MKNFLALFALVCGIGAEAAEPKPRLGVVIVVDQMRADYLERDQSFSGGLKRLAQEGAVLTNADYHHIPTETCPGHAAISSGRAPASNGIVSNVWFDRRSGSNTYCVADAPYGIGPGHLDGPTLADALKAQDPEARVFAVAGKDRAAVLLGGRRPDFALWLDRAKGEFTTSSYYRRPSWLAAFNAQLRASGLLPLKNGKVPPEVLASPAVDEATARLVSELMRRENVGHGPSRDLLLISFSGTDIIGHRYGTEAAEMVAQLRRLDGLLGSLLRDWEKASSGSLALALTADHGAPPSPEDPSGRARGMRRIDESAFSADLEKALQRRWPAPAERWVLSNQAPHVYLNRALATRRGLDWPSFTRAAAATASGLDGVARAFPAEVDLDRADPLAEFQHNSARPGRSGDLFIVMTQNSFLHDQPTGTSHGSPWRDDTHVPMVFWGRGIKPGRFMEPASPLDVAPTLGRLLGLDYPPGDGGAVRSEVLPEAR